MLHESLPSTSPPPPPPLLADAPSTLSSSLLSPHPVFLPASLALPTRPCSPLGHRWMVLSRLMPAGLRSKIVMTKNLVQSVQGLLPAGCVRALGSPLSSCELRAGCVRVQCTCMFREGDGRWVLRVKETPVRACVVGHVHRGRLLARPAQRSSTPCSRRMSLAQPD